MDFTHLHRHSGDAPCTLLGEKNVYHYWGRNHVKRGAHCWTWEDVYGPIPDGHVIHHTCFNKACVEITHLQCMTDKEHRVLHLRIQPRGQRHGPNTEEWKENLSRANTKLTQQQVDEIRMLAEAGMRKFKIAEMFGCAPSTISNVTLRRGVYGKAVMP